MKVLQGRSGNWAVFGEDPDYPDSSWFPTKAKATAQMRRMSGISEHITNRKKEESGKLIFGYTWEEIQAMQQGTYRRPTKKDAEIMRLRPRESSSFDGGNL